MDQYSVRNNLVLQFKRDSIDQSPKLAEMLFKRFGRDGDLEFSRRVFFSVFLGGAPRGGEGGGRTHLLFALVIWPSLSRRSTVPTATGDTPDSSALITSEGVTHFLLALVI